MKMGFHIPNSSNLKKMADVVMKTRGNSFQFYSRNMRGGSVPNYTEKQLIDYYNFLFTKRVSTVVMALPLFYKMTGNYTISGNLAIKNPALIEQILIDLENAKKVHAKYFVVHTGYYKDISEEEAIKNVLENLNEVLEKTDWEGTILVRNCVGEGTQVASDIYNFAKLVNSGNSRIKAAIDFGKLYAAGYNLVNIMEMKIVMEILKTEIGFENIPLVYLSDSNRFCGSKKDKSSVAIGDGVIGWSGFQQILRTNYFDNAVKIIEHHKEEQIYYDKIINFLLGMEV